MANNTKTPIQEYIDNHPLKVTDAKWAEFLGISREYFCKIRRGQRPPVHEVMVALGVLTGGAVMPNDWPPHEDCLTRDPTPNDLVGAKANHRFEPDEEQFVEA